MARSTSLDAHRIQASEIQRKIDDLAGVATTRLAYSEEDKLGRQAAMEMMRAAGLRVRTDAAGNIFGRRAGLADLPAIMFGSHIDTVREAGRFDGVLGVVAAIECIRALEQSQIRTNHPLEVAIFANEEGQNFGALNGSRAVVGALEAWELERADSSGRTLSEAIQSIGGRPAELSSSIFRQGEILAFVELHIEQGGELDRLGIPIGAVEGISGIQHTDVCIAGVANHSGTTAMAVRHDALVAAAEFVLLVRSVAADHNQCRVATVGRLTVSPNSTNIVPGEVELVLEIRDMKVERIANALQKLQEEAAGIEKHWGVEFQFSQRKTVDPVPVNRGVLQAIEASCEALELPFHRMPSGAGHDAQMIARIAPTGMIFVPSVGGISHSSMEFTTAEDCARGAEVLLDTILRLDRLSAEPGVSQP